LTLVIVIALNVELPEQSTEPFH